MTVNHHKQWHQEWFCAAQCYDDNNVSILCGWWVCAHGGCEGSKVKYMLRRKNLSFVNNQQNFVAEF